jgi:hypothetical protein
MSLGGAALFAYIPGVGPLLGSVAGLILKVVGETMKEVALAALEVLAYQSDLTAAFNSFKNLFDLNICLNEIPQIKRRFPTLAWFIEKMKQYSNIVYGWESADENQEKIAVKIAEAEQVVSNP